MSCREDRKKLNSAFMTAAHNKELGSAEPAQLACWVVAGVQNTTRWVCTGAPELQEAECWQPGMSCILQPCSNTRWWTAVSRRCPYVCVWLAVYEVQQSYLTAKCFAILSLYWSSTQSMAEKVHLLTQTLRGLCGGQAPETALGGNRWCVKKIRAKLS